MESNPFLHTHLFNLPLQHTLCQQIHCVAMKEAVDGLYPEAVPVNFLLQEWRERARYWGSEVYIAHPAHIDQVFRDLTLAVYQTIEELYCNRLERSIPMTHQILSKMAAEAGMPAVTYEAVWAICLYLEEKRQITSEVTLNRTEAEWSLMQLRPPINLCDAKGQVFSPVLLALIGPEHSTVLSFRFAHESKVLEAAALVLYDAISAQRIPSPEGVTGLLWNLPTQIDSQIDLSQETLQVLRRSGIAVRSLVYSTALPAGLTDWGNGLTEKTLDQQNAVRTFDFYLHQTFGYGPIRRQRNLTYKLSHLIGYSKDPAWQFPVLRQLLPENETVISVEGQVEYDGLHYEHPLLKYWPGQKVTLRQSEYAEATAWIYLDGDILCQAEARELRRPDGSYRLNRLQRG